MRSMLFGRLSGSSATGRAAIVFLVSVVLVCLGGGALDLAASQTAAPTPAVSHSVHAQATR